MKKYIFGAFMLMLASATFTSCVDDEEEHAEATVPYFTLCDTITYLDINDTIYTEMIKVSLDSLGITGSGSQFAESARVEFYSTQEAIQLCNQQAQNTYEIKIQDFTLEQIKHDIFLRNKEEKGWTNENIIDLDAFTAKLNLYGLYSNTSTVVKTYTKNFK